MEVHFNKKIVYLHALFILSIQSDDMISVHAQTIKRHVFNEPDVNVLVLGQGHKVAYLRIIDALHHHTVDLDGIVSKLQRRLNRCHHVVKPYGQRGRLYGMQAEQQILGKGSSSIIFIICISGRIKSSALIDQNGMNFDNNSYKKNRNHVC